MQSAVVLAGVLMLCAALCPGTLLAPSELGNISGFVKDPSGATVPNASICGDNQ